MSNPTSELDARLDRLEAKLDKLVAAQEAVLELADEGALIGREFIKASSPFLLELEQEGWGEMGSEAWKIVRRVVASYEPEDVAQLGDHVVAILDTVRNVTQPDVLEALNEATSALHDSEKLSPVGMFGAAAATRDDDVQHGIAVMLDVLKRLGHVSRHHAAGEVPPRRRLTTSAPAKPEKRLVGRAKAKALREARQGHAAAPAATGPAGLALDADGFLADPTAWTEDVAVAVATDAGIALSDDHWVAIRFARETWQDSGKSPNVRKLAVGSGLGTKTLYVLFPKAPGKTIARCAGIPKPVGCI